MSADKLLIVVVLYSKTTERVMPRTLACLDAAMVAEPELLEHYQLLLWDNSPEAWQPSMEARFTYRHAAGNDGVSGAYNGALTMALRDGYAWMLLLDDDTDVSAAYLRGMLKSRDQCHGDNSIAAIAPLLLDRDFQLSPYEVKKHRAAASARMPPRTLEEESFAANSGVLMRTATLQQIGGYSLDFWLDYSDIYVFHQLYAAGKRLYFAADLKLQHSMTMLDYDGRMTLERYSNFLYAEQAFFDLFKTASQHYVQVLRLSARVFRQRRYRNKAFSRLTCVFLLNRLTTSKATRLRIWSERKRSRSAGRSLTACVFFTTTR